MYSHNPMLNQLIQKLNSLQNPAKAKILQGFFKTGIWEYWEWDIFFGIQVPALKSLAREYINLNFTDLEKLLYSEIHEYRYMALAILRLKYEKWDENIKKLVFEFTIKHKSKINNWDLVDSFIPYTFWNYLINRDNSILYEFVKSENLWTRRIAIIATFAFIKLNSFEDTLRLCEILINDKQYLIHKAIGWMLREVWKRDKDTLLLFLNKFHKIMPRTALRYSIEKFSKEDRIFYMSK
jgi:3-methyladenine DNA glycosylase AlkD